ncbi:MAG TPA: hypothetical protein VN947_08875 [Polyangia bacterium]|nr:hypothetical protein [Polyangia bacterium]
MDRRARALAFTVASTVALGGCHSTLIAPTDAALTELDMGATADDGGDLDGGAGDLAGCVPKITSCTGLCGPIADACLGKNVECGGCGAGTVCNLVSHACEVPKTNCAQLGAQCGNVRNSCGTRLFCGDCPAGQECDPDSNQCVTCSNVTCGELGYQCGMAWLGCGPETNLTDCGGCPAGANPVCNPYFHTCEPSCTPPDTVTLCATAKSKRGVECGIISDGCGGYVDCGGCQAGFACGAQGDPNRCEPQEAPTECEATGRTCGTITSECGGTVNCGSCTPPAVCNPNGVCGPPCTPKTCAQLGNPQCGLVDDGCMGQVKCNDCPDSTYTCLANHTCCKKKSCSVDYAGKCGTGLDDGCGGTVDCGCSSGSCTSTMTGSAGTCCVNTAMCPAGACNTTVTDTCTGAPIQCKCDSAHWCDTSTNMCQPKKSCGDYVPHVPGQSGDVCSNGGSFDQGGGVLISCPCTQGEYCINGSGMVVTGTNRGSCCVDTACQGQACGSVVTNSCTGASETCGCPSGQFCSSGTCTPLHNCAYYGANHHNGDPCSNGSNPNWPTGGGANLTCPCTDGSICYTPGGTPATGGQQGVCCKNSAVCPAGSCNTTVTDTCTGQPIACACDSAHYCDTASNTCKVKLTCGSYGANGQPGNQCGSFSDGGGGMISCPCSTMGGLGNNTCVNGTCTCTASSCTSCTQNGTSNGCGGTKACACSGATPVCFPSAGGPNGCCAPYSCSSLPPGVPPPADAEHPICGSFNDHCGSSFGCACPANNPSTGSPWPNVGCVPQSGSNPAYGVCTCVPTPCSQLGAGPHNNDGCGHFVNCTS